MVNIVRPLLTLLASLTRQELAQQVRYLKAENEILRSKLILGFPKPDHLTSMSKRDSLEVLFFAGFDAWVMAC